MRGFFVLMTIARIGGRIKERRPGAVASRSREHYPDQDCQWFAVALKTEDGHCPDTLWLRQEPSDRPLERGQKSDDGILCRVDMTATDLDR